MAIVKDLTAVGVTAGQAWDHAFELELQQNANGFVPLAVVRDLRALSQSDYPPSNNMGGTSPKTPPFISDCEKQGSACARQKSKIDWLGFTSYADVATLQLVLETIWPGVTFVRNLKGMPGYPQSSAVIVDGVQFGQMGFGAEHGKNHVSLTGTACKTLTDELVDIFYEALSLDAVNATLTRLDLCFDFYRGERTFTHALWAYDQGHFKRPRASKNPKQKIIGEKGQNGENLGRTMYVGQRGGFVVGRVYEKGLEVFARLPDGLRLVSELRESDLSGQCQDSAEVFKDDTWLRLEAEFRRQDKTQELPLRMMVERDDYFAGAYPYFASALGAGDGVRPDFIKSDFDVNLLALIAAGKRSYGSLVHTLKQLRFTDAEIVEHLSADKLNDRLVRSGLFAKMRQAVADVVRDDPDFDIPF
jgi:DNA relaxase NicK